MLFINMATSRTGLLDTYVRIVKHAALAKTITGINVNFQYFGSNNR